MLLWLLSGKKKKKKREREREKENLPVMQEMQVQFLGWEDPLEKEMTTHSSILTWET